MVNLRTNLNDDFKIEIKDEDLNLGNIYSGNVSEWFPSLGRERVKEYNSFINGFVFLYNKIFNLSPKLNLNLIERNDFSSNLALYVSSVLFANASTTGGKSIFYFDLNAHDNFGDTNVKIITSKLRNSFIRSIKDELVDLESKVDSFYNSISSYSESKLFSFIEKVERKIDVNYKNKNISYPELEFYNNNDSNHEENIYNKQFDVDRFSKYRGESLAGNRLAKNSLINLMNIILCYNLEKKKNPLLELFDFSNITTLIGGAGVGKSMLITQALDYISLKANELNKPFVFIPINSDTKSEYKSLSERNLKRKFDIAYRGDSLNVILIEEIDTKIFPRNNINTNNLSELSYTGAFLESVDGINKYLGNFMIITTSNRALNTDNALKRRLMKNVIYVKGLETIDDYITVFKNKLKKGIKNNYVNISNWKSISELSKFYKFQGGDITNICSNMLNNIISGINFNQILGKENYNILNQIPKITDAIVINEIHKYHKSNILISNDKIDDKTNNNLSRGYSI